MSYSDKLISLLYVILNEDGTLDVGQGVPDKVPKRLACTAEGAPASIRKFKESLEERLQKRLGSANDETEQLVKDFVSSELLWISEDDLVEDWLATPYGSANDFVVVVAADVATKLQPRTKTLATIVAATPVLNVDVPQAVGNSATSDTTDAGNQPQGGGAEDPSAVGGKSVGISTLSQLTASIQQGNLPLGTSPMSAVGSQSFSLVSEGIKLPNLGGTHLSALQQSSAMPFTSQSLLGTQLNTLGGAGALSNLVPSQVLLQTHGMNGQPRGQVHGQPNAFLRMNQNQAFNFPGLQTATPVMSGHMNQFVKMPTQTAIALPTGVPGVVNNPGALDAAMRGSSVNPGPLIIGNLDTQRDNFLPLTSTYAASDQILGAFQH